MGKYLGIHSLGILRRKFENMEHIHNIKMDHTHKNVYENVKWTNLLIKLSNDELMH